MRKVAVRAIGDKDGQVIDLGVKLGGLLVAPGAPDAIGRLYPGREAGYDAIEALGCFRTEDAAKHLLRYSHARGPRRRRTVIEALKRTRSRLAVPRLRELLDDGGTSDRNKPRVCDFAADALAAILPDGPGSAINSDLPLRNKKIAEWKAYLQQRTD
jgi:hypothetical protein